MAAIAAVVVLAFDLVERLRRTDSPSPAAAGDPQRLGDLCDHAAWRRAQLVALLLVGYEVLLGNAISATSVDALHFSLHPLVSARLAFALGLLLAQAVVFWAGVVIVDADDAAVARAAQRRRRAGGVRAAGASRSRHLDLSARHRRGALDGAGDADGLRRARLPGAGLGDGVGAAALSPCLAGAAAVRRRAGAADPRVRALPVGAPFRRSRPAPADRRRVRASRPKISGPSCRQKLQSVLQQIDRARHSELVGAARARSRPRRTPRSTCGRTPTWRPSAWLRHSSSTTREGSARQPLRAEPARLCLDARSAGASRAANGRSSRKRRRSDPKSAGCSTPGAASATRTPTRRPADRLSST